MMRATAETSSTKVASKRPIEGLLNSYRALLIDMVAVNSVVDVIHSTGSSDGVAHLG